MYVFSKRGLKKNFQALKVAFFQYIPIHYPELEILISRQKQ